MRKGEPGFILACIVLGVLALGAFLLVWLQPARAHAESIRFEHAGPVVAGELEIDGTPGAPISQIAGQADGTWQADAEWQRPATLRLKVWVTGDPRASGWSEPQQYAQADGPQVVTFGVTEIVGLSEGDEISGAVAVEALTEATTSVRWDCSWPCGWDGVDMFRIENTAPFALCGDLGPGQVLECDTTLLSDGPHTVSAAGFAGGDASGAAGWSVSVAFEVANVFEPEPLDCRPYDVNGDGAVGLDDISDLMDQMHDALECSH